MTEFDIEKFFKTNKAQDVAENNLWVLERLCKKIDVVGRIYTKYTGDLSRCIDATEVSNECLHEIRSFLCYSAKKYGDLKIINTLLKLDEMMIKVDALSWQQAENNREKLSYMFAEYTKSIGPAR